MIGDLHVQTYLKQPEEVDGAIVALGVHFHHYCVIIDINHYS